MSKMSYSIKPGEDRTYWPNKFEYHLSLFGYVIGLISFWRFPYLTYENKGAPFVYVFLFLYVLVGIPLGMLEMTWGQYGNLSPVQAFRAVPAMQGVGICMVFLSCSCILYFGTVSYYLLLYLTSSFTYNQPWITCKNVWNSEWCQETSEFIETSNGALKTNQSVGNDEATKIICNNTGNDVYTSPSIEFWTKNLVHQDNMCGQYPNISQILVGSDSSNALLSPIIILSCFLTAKLILSAVALANFVRFTGKIGYILSPIPFIVMLILLIKCVTLEGASKGISALVIPQDVKSIFTPKVWKDACSQVFLSLMASSGGLITWSSYNRFYNKYQADASMLMVVVPVLSLVSTAAVFSVAGFLTDKEPLCAFPDTKGPMVPFVAFTEALGHMWGGPFVWGMVVFVTLFLSSAASLFPFMECILSTLSDSFYMFRHLVLRNITSIILLLLSVAAYIGLPCFLKGMGLQIIGFFDSFSLPLALMLVALAEMLLIFYSFGHRLLYTNAKAMTSCACMKSHFWSFVWGGLTPIVILGCMVYTVVGIVRDKASMASPPGSNAFWSDVAAGIYIGFFFLILVLVAMTKVVMSSGSCKERFRNVFTPHSSRFTASNGSSSSRSNGGVYLSDYSSHRPQRIEVLIDEDKVTTV